MDRRRALLASGGGFPENYLFKEGLGFREDLVYKTYFPYGAGATITNNSIYIHGGNGSAVLMLNHGTTITGSDQIISSVVNLDFSKYTKLCVESTDQANVSRTAYVGVFEIEGKRKPTLEKICASPYNYLDPYVDFYTGSTRTVHTLDISSKSGGSFVMVSPDFSLKLEVYNIWLE